MTDEAREILKRLDALGAEEVARLAISILLVSEDAIVWKVAASELDDAARARLVSVFLPLETQKRLADALVAASMDSGGVSH